MTYTTERIADRLFKTGGTYLKKILEKAEILPMSTWVGEPSGSSGSPIEDLMAVALSFIGEQFHHKTVFVNDPGYSETQALETFHDWGASLDICIFPQVGIGPYRVDFLVLCRTGKNQAEGIIVECDGHEFHERTKQQATHDKRRDRFLQMRGYKVLRFTGTEIWVNALECADQVLKGAASIAEEYRTQRFRAEYRGIPEESRT